MSALCIFALRNITSNGYLDTPTNFKNIYRMMVELKYIYIYYIYILHIANIRAIEHTIVKACFACSNDP